MAAVIPVVTKLSCRIIRILGCNPGAMTLQGTNTYILGTGKRRILLDSGEENNVQYINHLRAVLFNENVTLSHIFLSHWHHDHTGGVTNILETQDDPSYCQVWKYPQTETEDELSKYVKMNYFKHGMEFSIEGATLRVVHTPGHTTDHVVFYLSEENAVFSGDCILGEGTGVFENLYDYMNSLRTILTLQPSVLYPGHGNVVYHPQEKIHYYIEHRNEREKQILEALNKNPLQQFTEMDLVKLIYTTTPEDLWKAAAFNVNHHLTKLLKENKVKKTNSTWQCTERPN